MCICSLWEKECCALIRKLVCVLLLIVLLVPESASLADSEWANEKLPDRRNPVPFEIVPWDELPPDNPDQHHYLLLVLDQKKRDPRPDDAKNPSEAAGQHKDDWGNTDGIVILTLDTRAKRIMLTSIIRDAIIQRPDSTETKKHYGRINYVYNDYGPEALCRLISEHLGFRIEKYMMFTFFQVRDVIALPILGGSVDVQLTASDIDYLRNSYEVDPGWVVSVDGQYDIARNRRSPEGLYRMKPWAAVLYMRIRKNNSQGDLMRTQRARNVLSALADKCRGFSLDEANALANELANLSNKTNMSAQDLLEAAGYAWQLRNCTIEELRIPADGDSRPITYAEMAAKEINWPVSRAKMQDYLQNSFLVIDDDDE